MSVTYVLFDNEFVSREWATVLHEMREDGIWFNVNEGHRSIERQWYFWNCYQCKCCNNGNLAAYPSDSAPHIRTGRIDHAVDFANPEAVMQWLSAKGLKPTRPAGAGTSNWEPWHIEVDAAALRAFHERNSKPFYAPLPKHMEFAVRRFLFHRRQVRDLIRDRDQFNSQTQPQKWLAADALVKKAVRWRKYWRVILEAMLKRAVIAQRLKATDARRRNIRILRRVLGLS